MTTLVPTDAETERALAAFTKKIPGDVGIHARSLAHAWASGGGHLAVGHLAVRFLGTTDPPFTATVLRAPRGEENWPRIEFARVLLESHGVPHATWVHWSDEFADLAHHGFDPAAKFPTLRLDDGLTAPEVARLTVGLRDLATMTGA